MINYQNYKGKVLNTFCKVLCCYKMWRSTILTVQDYYSSVKTWLSYEKKFPLDETYGLNRIKPILSDYDESLKFSVPEGSF